MGRKKSSNKERVNFLVDKDTYDNFSKICDELGLVRSKNIELHMKRFIEEHKDILKNEK